MGKLKMRPRYVLLQTNPSTGEVMGVSVHYDIQLPNGDTLGTAEHGWHDARISDMAEAQGFAQRAIKAVATEKELEDPVLVDVQSGAVKAK